jgi:hypothetical protein
VGFDHGQIRSDFALIHEMSSSAASSPVSILTRPQQTGRALGR